MIGIGIGINNKRGLSEVQRLYNDYKAMVVADSGLIKNPIFTKALLKYYSDAGLLSGLLLAWAAEAGVKTRTSGVEKFISKGYSFDQQVTHNDLIQSTELSQPRLGGEIAAAEILSSMNAQGGTRFFNFTEISKAAGDAWTITLVINWNGSTNAVSALIGKGSDTLSIIGKRTGSANRFYATNDSGTTVSGTSGYTNQIIGKNAVIHYIANGDGTLRIKINGTLLETLTIPTNFKFSKLFKALSTSGSEFFGNCHFIAVHGVALSTAQALGEATKLRTLIPELETVTIGSLEIASTNADVVATSNGVILTDAQLTATWITADVAGWCYHTDMATGALYGKLYNRAARNQLICNPPSGYRLPTEAELIALVSEGLALKLAGSNHWTTANGTDLTGLALMGGASRNADGTYNTIKETASVWAGDSDKVLQLTDAGVASIETATYLQGHSIRLVKGTDNNHKLFATGDGSGVSTLSMQVSDTVVVTLTGGAKFYTDSGGTLGESSTWTITSGAMRTIYIRCASGVSNLSIDHYDRITKIGDSSNVGYSGSTNTPRLLLQINQFTNLTSLRIEGICNLNGALPTGLTYLRLEGNLINWTYTGSLPTDLTYLYLSGNLIAWTYNGALPTGLTYLRLSSTLINWTYNTITGSTTFTTFTLTNYRITKMSSADMVVFLDSLRTKTGNLPATITINDYADYASPPAEVVTAKNALIAAGKGVSTINLGA